MGTKFNTSFMIKLMKEDQYYYLKKHFLEVTRNGKLEVNWDILSLVKSTDRVFELFKNQVNWEILSMNNSLTMAFINTYTDKLNKNTISKYLNLDRIYMGVNAAVLNWGYLIEHQDICGIGDMGFVDSNISRIDLKLLIIHNPVDEVWLELNYASLDHDLISRYQVVSGVFIANHVLDLDFNSLLVGGSIATEASVNNFITKVDLNIALEFINFTSTFLNTNYIDLNKNRIWRYQRNYTDAFLIDKLADIDMFLLSKYADLTLDQLNLLYEHLDTRLISKFQTNMDDLFIETHFDDLEHRLLSKYQTLSEVIILHPKHINYWDVNYISIYQNITHNILMSTLGYVFNFNLICYYQNLVEVDLNYFKKRLDWSHTSEKQTLSNVFINDNIDNLDPILLPQNQNMSEMTIDANKTQLNMDAVSKHCVLSELFMHNNRDILNIDYLLEHQVMTPVFRDSIIDWFETV